MMLARRGSAPAYAPAGGRRRHAVPPTAAQAAGPVPRRRPSIAVAASSGDGDNNGSSKSSSTPTPPPKRPPLNGPGRPPRGGPPGPGGPAPGGSYAALLASLLAYSGLVGTVAVALGYAAGVDPFGGARLDLSDVALALALLLPVTASNVAVLGFEHVDWQLPDVDRVVRERAEAAEREDAAAEAAAAEAERRRQQGDDGEGAEAVSEAPEAAAPPPGAAPAATTTTTTTTTPPPNPPPPFSPPRRLRDALSLAQGAYLQAYSPAAAQLPFAVEASAVLVDCAASEMLWRAVLLRGAGGWLADRLYEAGLEDALQPLAARLVLPPQAAEAASAASASAVAALASALLPGGSSGDDGALLGNGGLFGEGAGADLAPLAAWMVLAATVAAAAGALARRLVAMERQRRFMAALTTAAAKAAQQQKKQEREKQMRKQELEGGGVQAPAAADDKEDEATPTTTPLPGAPKNLLPPNVADAVALSQLLQGSRDVYQLAALGVSFLLTGNLAAPVLASAANGVLLSAMARRALARQRSRSEALSKELETLNARLAEIAREQRKRRSERQRREEQRREEERVAAAAAAARASRSADETSPLGETLSALERMLEGGPSSSKS